MVLEVYGAREGRMVTILLVHGVTTLTKSLHRALSTSTIVEAVKAEQQSERVKEKDNDTVHQVRQLPIIESTSKESLVFVR